MLTEDDCLNGQNCWLILQASKEVFKHHGSVQTWAVKTLVEKFSIVTWSNNQLWPSVSECYFRPRHVLIWVLFSPATSADCDCCFHLWWVPIVTVVFTCDECWLWVLFSPVTSADCDCCFHLWWVLIVSVVFTCDECWLWLLFSPVMSADCGHICVMILRPTLSTLRPVYQTIQPSAGHHPPADVINKNLSRVNIVSRGWNGTAQYWDKCVNSQLVPLHINTML